MVYTIDQFKEITGLIPYGLTNDYMFRAVLQNSNFSLKHLLSALLEIPYKEIRTCEIRNPIVLGDALDGKTCILDVSVLLNSSQLIDLEMQVGHLANWPDRAVYYLCRLFCNLGRGQDYNENLPSTHIGILTHSPFQEVKEFYSRYLLTNQKNGHIFTGNFALNMLDLSQIENVSEEMRATELYAWARLIRAVTWEEVHELVKENPVLEEAACYLHVMTEDEKIQMQCEGRALYYADMRSSRETGRQEGLKEARALYQANMENEREEGRKEGESRINRLNAALSRDNRIDDLLRSTTDKEYQKVLLEEYKL